MQQTTHLFFDIGHKAPTHCYLSLLLDLYCSLYCHDIARAIISIFVISLLITIISISCASTDFDHSINPRHVSALTITTFSHSHITLHTNLSVPLEMEIPDEHDRHALQFPDTLPDDAEDVPFPINNYPQWTTEPYASVDIPPTFDTLITLPNPLEEPAFYAAAVDCLRMTNCYFELTGNYSEQPLTEEHVRWTLRRWPSTVNNEGKRVKLAPAHEYPIPPDGRILYVKEAMGDPTDPKSLVLWIKACRSVKNMSDTEWALYLSYSRDYLVGEAKQRVVNDGSWLIYEIFKRYLVRHELVEGISQRAEKYYDEQPSPAELEAFFNQPDVQKNGATLVDICHAFPRARDAQMLVLRIEHFASLTSQPPVKTTQNVDDPVESRYMPKPHPTATAIKTAISAQLRRKGDFLETTELFEPYWPSTANRRLIADILDTMTAPDVTTGRLILPSAVPSTAKIDRTMQEADYINGFTLQELAERFPDRVASLEALLDNIDVFTYFDESEERFFPFFVTEDNTNLSHEDSISRRDRARLDIFDRRGEWDPDTVLEDFLWDASTMTYVMRRGQSEDELTEEDEESLPDTVGGSLLQEMANSLHVPVTTVRTVPVELAQPQATLSGVLVVAETSPVVTPAVVAAAAAASSSTPPGSPPAPAEPLRSNRGRPSKRAATEPTEPSRGTKKARRTSKIQCASQTQKGTRCKRRKNGEDGEEEWYCATHREA